MCPSCMFAIKARRHGGVRGSVVALPSKGAAPCAVGVMVPGAWSESDFEVKTGQYEASSLRFQADTLAVCLQFRRGATRGATGSVAAFPFEGAAPCAVAAAAADAAPKITETFLIINENLWLRARQIKVR